jgi:sugar lactone lactonase YvrE
MTGARASAAMADAGAAADGGDPPLDPFPIARVLAARPETFARFSGWGEGPSFGRGSVFVCSGTSLMRVELDGRVFTHMNLHCGGTYPLADGSMLVSGKDGITQLLSDGRVALLAEAPNGQFANDLTIDGAGNVYFTVQGRYVHRVTPEGRQELIGDQIWGATGIDVDPANRFLYVVAASDKTIQRFALPSATARLGKGEVVVSAWNGDGCAFDAYGNLWLTGFQAGEVGVFDVANRRELARISLGLAPASNLAFGGAAFDDLFVTAGKPEVIKDVRLLRLRVGVRGFRGFPGAAAYRALRFLPSPVLDRPFQQPTGP